MFYSKSSGTSGLIFVFDPLPVNFCEWCVIFCERCVINTMFCQWCVMGVQFQCSACVSPVFSAPFVEDTVIFPLCSWLSC